MCLVPLFFHDDRISCGKCSECLRMLRSDWNYRCDQEALCHKYNYFFTLTFNDDYLPPDEKGVWDCHTLFRKSCFKNFGSFAYFVSMERGEKNGRLHLHMLSFSDVPLSKKIIRQCWPYGFIKRSTVTPKRVRYCTSYMFDPDPCNKVKMYRSSNNLGGVPVLPYRVRRFRSGRCERVPLPRYYCRKFSECKAFARKYYDNLYHDNDFLSVYFKCRERWFKRPRRYGEKLDTRSYEQFIVDFLQARVRKYKTFVDSRDLIALPGPDSYLGLNRVYTNLLNCVTPILRRYGVQFSGNLPRYLTIDCPMSLRSYAEQKIRSKNDPPSLKKYLVKPKKQLDLFPRYC